MCREKHLKKKMDLDIDNAGPSSKSSDVSIDIDCDETQIDSATCNKQKPNRKRRLSMIEEEPSGKVFVQDDDYHYSKLLSLSDEVLLEILKNCNSLTLDALSK